MATANECLVKKRSPIKARNPATRLEGNLPKILRRTEAKAGHLELKE